MRHVFIDEENLTNTANAIREKTGGKAPYKPAEFAEHIRAIPQNFTPPTVGLMLNSFDEDGFCTDANIVGYTDIPANYLYYAGFNGSGWLAKIGAGLHLQEGVKSIGNYAFAYNTGLTDFALPDLLETIGDYAFRGCSKLCIETLPDSVTSIGQYCFDSCTKLTKMILPPRLTALNQYTFQSCTSLEECYVPDGITEIPLYCFSQCPKLSNLRLPDSIKTLSNYAFNACTKLALEKLPDNLETIGSYCFSNNYVLPLTSLPDNLTKIGSYTFSNCRALLLEAIPDKVNTIDSYAFYECDTMPLQKLPDALTTLGARAFYNCKAVAISEVPEGVKIIPEYCFYYCQGITELNLKGPLTQIANYAFNYCSNLSKLVLSGVKTVPTLSNTNAFNSSGITSSKGEIQVPHNLIESFKTANNWKTYASRFTLLELTSIEIKNKNINSYFPTTELDIKYNGTQDDAGMGEYAGYTVTISDNATLDGNMLTLNEGFQLGDKVTITVTSTYNPEITTTKELEVIYKEVGYELNLNDGQWIESTPTTANNISYPTYKSDAGSYNINNGESKAVITLKNLNKFVLMIKSYSQGGYDYVNVSDLDKPTVRGTYAEHRKYSTNNNNGGWVTCTYDNIGGGIHTIEVLYTKNASTNQYDDRGYFYIKEFVEYKE